MFRRKKRHKIIKKQTQAHGLYIIFISFPSNLLGCTFKTQETSICASKYFIFL